MVPIVAEYKCTVLVFLGVYMGYYREKSLCDDFETVSLHQISKDHSTEEDYETVMKVKPGGIVALADLME
ncbi:hypothetical protein QVD17_26317 [Tagetes erecta]|uniref:Uncharacterized protein n=1 Tax=Tagetes erecta TaxID=13708 RepID=A0AAD8K792_TARER|nr:hypothetical protein QVD17_26317 [Tagetes erecta]